MYTLPRSPVSIRLEDVSSLTKHMLYVFQVNPRSIGFRVQSNILDKFVARELKATIKHKKHGR